VNPRAWFERAEAANPETQRAMAAALSREDALEILAWNDPNGTWRDNDEDPPLTTLEAHRCVLGLVRTGDPTLEEWAG
jgi:hypothetical protein